MAETRTIHHAVGERVRAAIAQADRRRRTREAGRQLWRAAPLVAAVSLGIAAGSHWGGWPAIVPLGVIGAGVLGLTAYLSLSRRDRVISDAVAAEIDADAGLGGELRSASWFAARESRDAWTDVHLEWAAARLHATDWARLYPTVRAPRARLATLIMVIGALALVITLPERFPVRPNAFAQASTRVAARGNSLSHAEMLPPELQKRLEELLAAAETGTLPTGENAAGEAELRDLLARLGQIRDPDVLKELARAMDANPRQTDRTTQLKTLAERARRAAEMAGMSQEMREALEKLADQLELVESEQTNTAEGTDPAASAGAQQGETGPTNAAAGMEEASIQFLKDADAGGGAGVVMMSSQDGPRGDGPPGAGAGGSGSLDAAGRMIGIEQALRQETVEASVDNAGQNVLTETRRKTEHGRATVTFTGSASGTSDRARASAPPAVPEARRAGVQTYFIRKQ